MSVMEELEALRQQALAALAAAPTLAEVEQVRIGYLGRKGALTAVLRGMSQVPPEERPSVGQRANEVRLALEAALLERQGQVAAEEAATRLETERIDVTLPGRHWRLGSRHPIEIVLSEARASLVGMGFEVLDGGPEVETYQYNFGMLNYPEDHPAMDEQATFYLSPEVLLRTQTSGMQVRTMEQRQPPLKVAVPGRCYRREVVTATHSHTFHQVEGFLVDRDVTFGDLQGVLAQFARDMFGLQTKVCFRPDFFPFTEPSADYSVTCTFCQGSGCRLCKESGWMELGGCGMIHPHVLQNVGYDTEIWNGYAFGLGVDRIAQVRYGIGDIRLLAENDMQFLEQF